MGIGRVLFKRDLLFSICQRYCNYVKHENNDNIKTNGELNFLKKNLPECDIVFDVGANIGLWAQLALNINPGAKIHCFEPIKHNFEELAKKQWPSQVKLVNEGLSSDIAEQNIYTEVYSLYKREGLSARYGIPVPSKQEKIKLNTIDNYCTKNSIEKIDLLKMDIEGHELFALKGAVDSIQKEKILRITIEYGGTDIASRVLLKDFFDMFDKKPYSIYLITPKKLLKIPEYDITLENYQYKNFAIIHDSVSIDH